MGATSIRYAPTTARTICSSLTTIDMAIIKNIVTSEAVYGGLATTCNAASSYGMPVWADRDGIAYAQVGAEAPAFDIDLEEAELRAVLGRQIKDRRKALGLTISRLSTASKVSADIICRVEGGAPANINSICRMASAMGCKISISVG